MAGTAEQDMAIQLKGRDFIGLVDYAPEEIQYLIELAVELKKKQKAGEVYQPLAWSPPRP